MKPNLSGNVTNHDGDYTVNVATICPFCGGSMLHCLQATSRDVAIECWNCFARGPLASDESETDDRAPGVVAAGKWDQRAALAPLIIEVTAWGANLFDAATGERVSDSSGIAVRDIAAGTPLFKRL
jgi:hypothetical protein